MAKLVWDAEGERDYEAGVDHGVLFVQEDSGTGYKKGVVWNGLTTVTDSPEGAEDQDTYADNIKYISLKSPEEYKGTIEAVYYPPEFEECDGSKEVAPGVFLGQQQRKRFCLYYRTRRGNDGKEIAGYKHHFIYGLTAQPSEQEHATVNDSPEPMTFSWEVSALKQTVEGYQPTATVVLDETRAGANLSKVQAVIKMVEGSDSEESKIPSITDVIAATKNGV